MARTRPAFRHLVVVLATALAAAACNGEGAPAPRVSPQPEPSPTPQPSPSPAPSPFDPPSPCPAATGGRDGLDAHLTALRTERGEGSDRVVFEFSPAPGTPAGVPRFEMGEIQPPLRQDGSGAPLELDGEVLASIVFHGARGFVQKGDTFEQTYPQPDDIKPDLGVVVHILKAGDFEATLSWGIGLRSRSCWKASVLQDPPRAVIEIPHPPGG